MWNCFSGSGDEAFPSGKVPYITDEQVQHMHGVIYLLEYAVGEENVAVLKGSNLIQQFDTHRQNGNLSRQDALPIGLVDLAGKTLSTLDNATFAKRQSALLDAFSIEQVAKYQSKIDAIVQSRHSAWAARGGSFSIAVETKKLVFHIFVGVILGLEDQYDAVFNLVNQYRELLPKSLRRPHAKAITLRQEILSKLITPAVTSSRTRVANKQTNDSVVDYLIRKGQLSDADITIELFQALIDGTDGISSLVINCVNAWVNQPGLSDKLASVRDAPDTFVNQFIDEVERVYTAGPSHEYARVVKNTTFTTPKGSFTLPKGQLVVAFTESINEDASVWPNPTLFDPSRFENDTPDPYKFTAFSLLQLVNRVQNVREAFTKAVLRSNMSSLLNCMWQMVPLQSYELTEHTVTNPTPVGQLTVVNFHKRHEQSANSVATAGTPEDWKFLEQPEAKQYADCSESLDELFADKRLDVWTNLTLKLLERKQAKWNRPFANSAITVPKYQAELPKIQLYGTNINVPTEDEDWPSNPWIEVKTVEFLRDSCPVNDNFDDMWLPGEDMESYVMSKVGKIWPRVNVHWNDRYSDRALELLAFNGLGQHMLEKLPDAHDDSSYYGIFMNYMDGLDVRPGYAKYGADAYFDRDGIITKIVRQGVTYQPKDAGWEYAKLCFRGSLITKVTAVDHLLGIHVTVANSLVTSSREQLPPNHPLRRLIKPFTFRTVIINHAASYALFWPKGMLHRAFALSLDGMQQTWEFGLANFKYETFPEHKARQNIDTATLPYHEDGIDYWNIVHNFVSEYLDLYYKSDDSLLQDDSVVAFWEYLKSTLPKDSIRPLTLVNLKDFIAHSIFLVSSMHNHLGTIAEYVPDPAFCPSAWVEGELAGRPGTSVRASLIMGATGFAQPSIKEDFSHIMLDDEAKAICKKFTAEVSAFSAVVIDRNTRRKQPYQSFNPDTMEMAVSI
ncbi:hypothetical protein THRCLA_04012 [Thraustotheca clavata]|uniref:Lipoxygenase domain-containing protein n=1 Tax=Thraustotheca clavata TaxID=74557 RepID=A0A1W0A073_9STRA|nr:hypothetical protein THRCLA_04012 [Thraustotheca clavata]